MKKLVYYITDHGKGHATRTIAIIRELRNFNIEVIVRNSNSFEFLKNSLPKTRIIQGKTDQGTILQSDGISIDISKSLPIISKWISEIPSYANQESDFLKKQNPDLVISDISAMPILASNKSNLSSLVISNFSWYDVLDFLNADDKNKLKEYYDCADHSIKLPFGTKMNHFQNIKNVGLIARKPKTSKQELRKILKIPPEKMFVLISLGGSENVDIRNNPNIKFFTLNTNLKGNILSQDLSSYLEVQDLVNLADLVICKCGYGFVSECVSSETPFLYVSDKNHKEQTAIISELNYMNCGREISINDLKSLEINQTFIDSIPIHKIPIKTEETITKINEFLS